MRDKAFMQHETNSGPLSGVRVLELGVGVAAPYAGLLFRLLGAKVIKMEPPEGDPCRHQPIDDSPLSGLSPLYSYLNAGKSNVTPSPDRLRLGLDWADVILDSRVSADLPDDVRKRLARRSPVTYAAVTAWGCNSDTPGNIDDELLVQAMSGCMTLTGDPDAPPLRFPGFQSQYLAGAYATATSLVSLLTSSSAPRVIEVTWLGAMATGPEGSFQRYLYTKVVQPPAGAHPLASFPSGAFVCRDGFVVPGSVRQHDWDMQTVLYGIENLATDERFATPDGRTANYQELWDLIQPWYDERSRKDIFECALELGWACGMVLRPADASADEHLSARQFLGPIRTDSGEALAPRRLAIGLEASEAGLAVNAPGQDDAWFDAELVASA